MSTFFSPVFGWEKLKSSKGTSIKGWFIWRIRTIIRTIKNDGDTDTAPKAGFLSTSHDFRIAQQNPQGSIIFMIQHLSKYVPLSGTLQTTFLFLGSQSFPSFIAFFSFFSPYFLSDLPYSLFPLQKEAMKSKLSPIGIRQKDSGNFDSGFWGLLPS